MPHRQREEVINTVLALCIAHRGVPASPETIQQKGRARPDVIAIFRGLRCAIEGKVGDVSNAKNLVLSDAKRRVEQGIAQIAVGIVYPIQFRNTEFADLPNALDINQLDFCVYTEVGPGKWRIGGIDTILDELRRAHDIIVQDDVVQAAVEELSLGLTIVADNLLMSSATCDRLIQVLGIGKASSDNATQKRRRRETTAKLAALSLANALIFQEQLANADSRVLPLRRLLASSDLITQIAVHWEYICDTINYIPIFHIAREIILSLPSTQETVESLKTLIKTALLIVSRKAALRHDLMGRIYHYLLLEAKYLGTFYTSVSGATLLLKLSLNPDTNSTNYANLDSICTMRIADLACGTGTLLMASCQALIDNFVRSNAKMGYTVDENVLKKLHQIIMEDVIHGYDVLPSAVHLTASTLALLDPEISFKKMHLYSLPLGSDEGGQIYLGSIEYLGVGGVYTQLDLMGRSSAAFAVTGAGPVASLAPLPKLDLCVMNPPFVRSVNSNLLFGSVPDYRSAMQRELRRRINSDDRVMANITAGLGSVFAAIGHKYVKRGGRMSLVLPAAITTGGAWERTRRMIEQDYVLEYLVATHDAEKWSFSENTNLSEVLIVARKKRRDESIDQAKTRFVNLWRTPKASADALSIGEEIIKSLGADIGDPDHPATGEANIMLGSHVHGQVVAIPWRDLRGEPWVGCAFAQTDLVRTNWLFRRGYFQLPGSFSAVAVPTCRLEELGELGPDGRDIHDGFTRVLNPTSYATLWNHNSSAITSLAVSPNAYLSPRSTPPPGRPKRPAYLLWPRAARLLIGVRLRFNTHRLVAVRSNRESLSNVWYPFKFFTNSEDSEKVLALWLNSSIGILILSGHRVPTEGPWAQFKKPTLNKLPTLDVRALSESQLRVLVRVFDEIATDTLRPLCEMDEDPRRQVIDRSIEIALGLPSLAPLRELLSREPVICNYSIPNADAAGSIADSQFSLDF